MGDRERKQRDYWNQLADLPPDTAVFDPSDQRGDKNAYIASIRDTSFATALKSAGGTGAIDLVLDFGCGTGSTSLELLRQGYRVLGVDIARSLLVQARRRCDDRRSLFVAIDGTSLPLASEAFDAAVSYVVLSYVVEDKTALDLLKAIRTSLKPGSQFVAIEQCRTETRIVEGGLKAHRSINKWTTLFNDAGFRNVTSHTIRHGHFPLTPIIRAGFIPRLAWPAIRAIERIIGSVVPILPCDYAETLFEATA